MTRQIYVCADDYAQNQLISSGILALARARRINAISCLSNMELWPVAAVALAPIKTTHFIGLHVNLTEGLCLSDAWRLAYGANFSSLGSVLSGAYTKRIAVDIVAAEISAQWDRFVDCLGGEPDFIDGHQHVHQFPIIRDALFSVYATKSKSQPFIRATSHGWHDLVSWQPFPKAQLIACLGGLVFKKALTQRQLPTHHGFSGIYSFKLAHQYPRFARSFLKQLRDGGLMMCHPGHPGGDDTDPLCQSRPQEFNYFMSDAFLCDLQDNAVELMTKDC